MEIVKSKIYVVGETYIKLGIDFNDINKSKIKDIYNEKLFNQSKEYFRESKLIKISIDFDKGSLKTKIVIWGTVLYLGIGNYGSFRSGIRQIVQDSKVFSEFIISVYNQDIGQNNFERTEKRLGIPGRINKIYRKIDSLERNLNTISNEEILTSLNNIKQEISNISTILHIEEREQFYFDLPDRYKNNLPQPSPDKVRYLITRYGLKPEETEIIEEY